MNNPEKILRQAALELDLIARLIEVGAPLESTRNQLHETKDSLDDALVSAKWHGRHAYSWVDHPQDGWIIVKFT